MNALLRDILSHLVEDPANLRISELSGAKTRVLEIACAKEDYGRIVGRNGKTIQAIRTLLAAINTGDANRVNVEVVAPGAA